MIDLATRFGQQLPVLNRMNGVFTGTYLHLDPEGHVLDRHASHMHTWIDADGRHQVNTYSWADGRQEVHRFDSAAPEGSRMVIENERMYGEVWDADPRTVMLWWRRKDRPGSLYYELAQLSHDGCDRTRVWQCFQDERLVGRVLINERRVPDIAGETAEGATR